MPIECREGLAGTAARCFDDNDNDRDGDGVACNVYSDKRRHEEIEDGVAGVYEDDRDEAEGEHDGEKKVEWGELELDREDGEYDDHDYHDDHGGGPCCFGLRDFRTARCSNIDRGAMPGSPIDDKGGGRDWG